MVSATNEDMRRVHERLDALLVAVSKVQAAVQVREATCEPCYKVVMGNGKLPISERVSNLETEGRVSRRWLAGTVGVAGVVSSLLTIVTEAAFRYLGG